MKKRCSHCKQNKGVKHFTKNSHRCRSCNSSYSVAFRTANPTYQSYRKARERCNNKNDHSYRYYGGRGIEFHIKSWRDIVHAIGPRPPGCTLDRINTNSHYSVGNIRWATQQQQIENTRRFRRTPEFVNHVKLLAKNGLKKSDIAYLTSTSYTLIRRSLNDKQI